MVHEAETLRMSAVEELPSAAHVAASPDESFRYRYTTGPFQLPPDAGSLDWIVMNNDTRIQEARVTVYQGGVGMQKTPIAPGPLTVAVAPGEATHNANTYPTGYVYEIQVETNSRSIFPYVSVWPGNFGEAIPGTAITSASFLSQMPARDSTAAASDDLVADRTARVVTDAWHDEQFGSSLASAPVVLSSIESYWGSDPAAARLTDVTANGFKVRVEEERSLDDETEHLPEVIAYLAAEPGPVHDDLGNVIGEMGAVSVDQADPDQWHTVTLANELCTPVVIAQVMTEHGTDPCHVRIRNVTGGSFEMQIEEWDYLTGHHLAEDVGYLVLEARRHRLPSGRVVEAGRYTTDHQWASVELGSGSTEPPVVLTMCQTLNGPAAVVTRERAITPTGFEVRLQEEEANDGLHAAETVGFVAVAQT